eukprot:1156570-Pelagomonas_calceolata.AAC.1
MNADRCSIELYLLYALRGAHGAPGGQDGALWPGTTNVCVCAYVTILEPYNTCVLDQLVPRGARSASGGQEDALRPDTGNVCAMLPLHSLITMHLINSYPGARAAHQVGKKMPSGQTLST